MITELQRSALTQADGFRRLENPLSPTILEGPSPLLRRELRPPPGASPGLVAAELPLRVLPLLVLGRSSPSPTSYCCCLVRCFDAVGSRD